LQSAARAAELAATDKGSIVSFFKKCCLLRNGGLRLADTVDNKIVMEGLLANSKLLIGLIGCPTYLTELELHVIAARTEKVIGGTPLD
jgi:hypothetical protein